MSGVSNTLFLSYRLDRLLLRLFPVEVSCTNLWPSLFRWHGTPVWMRVHSGSIWSVWKMTILRRFIRTYSVFMHDSVLHHHCSHVLTIYILYSEYTSCMYLSVMHIHNVHTCRCWNDVLLSTTAGMHLGSFHTTHLISRLLIAFTLDLHLSQNPCIWCNILPSNLLQSFSKAFIGLPIRFSLLTESNVGVVNWSLCLL